MTKPITKNFDERPDDAEINILIMHYTGMKTAQDALDIMCSPDSKVSAHYMIYEDGTITNLVDESKRAWHAGISCWQGRSALNDTSIGIEIVNPGHEFGYTPFPKEQMQAVASLSKDIITRHNIEARNVIGHSDIAPSRKQDPGELFDWECLAQEGIGLYPKPGLIWRPDETLVEPGKEGIDVSDIQKRLADYGYHIRVDGYYGPKMEYVVKAFKRHFVPKNLNISWDKVADKQLNKLLEII